MRQVVTLRNILLVLITDCPSYRQYVVFRDINQWLSAVCLFLYDSFSEVDLCVLRIVVPPSSILPHRVLIEVLMALQEVFCVLHGVRVESEWRAKRIGFTCRNIPSSSSVRLFPSVHLMNSPFRWIV